jgi:hypothetical protein
VIYDLIEDNHLSIIMMQEHWLTPANLYLFDKTFCGYFHFGSSAMSNATQSGFSEGQTIRRHNVYSHQ